MVTFFLSLPLTAPLPRKMRQIHAQNNGSIFTKLGICFEYSKGNNPACLSDLARAPGPGHRDNSACLHDSASDPARGMGATTTRRVSVTQPRLQGPDAVTTRCVSMTSPATPLGGWVPQRPGMSQ